MSANLTPHRFPQLPRNFFLGWMTGESKHLCAALLRATLLGVVFVLASALAHATADTIKIVVPFAAGGPVDQLARILGHELGPKLGADVIVDNRGGAGGALACDLVAHASPDGSTILLGSLGSQVLSPILKAPTTYDPTGAFAPVMLVGSVPSILVVSSKLGVSDLQELMARARSGQQMTYASAGPGTTMNIAGEMFNAAAGLKVTHVPYRGAAPAISDLLGGHVDMLSADLPVLLPLVAAGTVKPLALLGTQRSPLLPAVPTMLELGLPGVVMENWYGVFVPIATPPAVQSKLEAALFSVLEIPSVKERSAANGMRGTLGADAFRAKLPKEFAFWRNTIETLGITAE
jgi:tripartite-type tricarboxylate transporter receptor subunit TctC